jgi:hypothetical protein
VPPPAAENSAKERMVLIGLGTAIVVLVGAIVAAVVLAMRMDVGEPPVTARPTSAQASAPTAALGATAIEPTAMAPTKTEKPSAAVGEEVRDGAFSFVVTGLQRVDALDDPEDPDVQKDAQGEFVIVQTTVTNVDAEAHKFYPSFSTLSDGNSVYRSDNEAWLFLGNTLSDLNPGDSVDTAVVFDVPDGTDVRSIELHDSPSSGGATVGL